MILAAGLGTRLAPLTDTLPKPLIEVGGQSLIERHVRALACAGVREIVVNISHLGHLIEERLGDGHDYGVDIAYSREPGVPLETGGGIVKALPLLGADPFLVVNADIVTDFPFRISATAAHAHLVLVPNPPHNPDGDFGLAGGRVTRGVRNPFTYTGIGVYRCELFGVARAAAFPLAPLLFEGARAGLVSGEVYGGRWFDTGTPERLAAARAEFEADRSA